MLDVLILILGLAVLVIGGELLVRGAVGIATWLKISPLVIGLTVVSFGTSAPELLVSVNAAIANNPGIAIGNVLGSNIANIALVLGVTVLIFPIVVERQTKVLDWPFMMLMSLVFLGFASDLILEWWEGLIMFLALAGFTAYLIINSRKKTKASANSRIEDGEEELEGAGTSVPMSLLYLSIGLVGLYFGSEWLLEGAVAIAESLGMEQHIIGLTIVAFGTSAPELVASCVAAYRQQTDISIGNLIGSNIFNICAVLGITAMVKPVGIDQAIMDSDMFWMLAISLAILPMMLFGKKIGRFKGFLLVSTYVVYISLLVISAKP